MEEEFNRHNLTYESPLPKFVRVIMDLMFAAALAVLLTYIFGTSAVMKGASMSPTIESGSEVLINRFAGSLGKLKRFDVIVYQTEDGQTCIKRIIGLPEETVELKDGILWINGSETDYSEFPEQIRKSGITTNSVKVGSGEYFVLGDYPEASEDSRFAEIGNISEERVIGRAWFVLKPFKKIGLIR